MNPSLPSSPSTVPHLPVCTGTISPLNRRGLVLTPAVLSVTASGRVSPFATIDAAQRLICGGVLPKLERVDWVLPQDRGPHMLVECVRGVEEPEPEAEPAGEATTATITPESGSGSGENGPDSTPAPCEETRVEAPALGGSNLPPAPAFVFN